MVEEKFNRRRFLEMVSVAGLMLLTGEFMYANEDLALDHMLLAINDRDRGMDWIESKLGVKPVIGGNHPGMGTRNALLSIGPNCYLEIIAPDPDQKTYTFPIDIRSITEPQIITWCVGTKDIETLVKKAKESGFNIMGPFAGSRTRPDGKILKWKNAFVQENFRVNNVDPVPFFIEWASDTLHPSQDSPKGCTLQTFEIEHPRAGKLQEVFKSLGLDAKVNQSENAKLIATIASPKGEVKLS
jgi:hypothetical protein